MHMWYVITSRKKCTRATILPKNFGNGTPWQQLLFLAAILRNNKSGERCCSPPPLLANDYVMAECFQIQFIQPRFPMGRERRREGVELVFPLELDYTCWRFRVRYNTWVTYRIWVYWLSKWQLRSLTLSKFYAWFQSDWILLIVETNLTDDCYIIRQDSINILLNLIA